MKSDSPTAKEAIRIEAYLLSEKAGHPAGMEAYFWQEAELIVAGQADPVSEKAAAPKRLAAKSKTKNGPAAKGAPAAKKPKPKTKT